jgi:hypothetical protein
MAPTIAPTSEPTEFIIIPKPVSTFFLSSSISNAYKTPDVNLLEKAMFESLVDDQTVNRDLILAEKSFTVTSGIRFAVAGPGVIVEGFTLSLENCHNSFRSMFDHANFEVNLPASLDDGSTFTPTMAPTAPSPRPTPVPTVKVNPSTSPTSTPTNATTAPTATPTTQAPTITIAPTTGDRRLLSSDASDSFYKAALAGGDRRLRTSGRSLDSDDAPERLLSEFFSPPLEVILKAFDAGTATSLQSIAQNKKLGDVFKETYSNLLKGPTEANSSEPEEDVKQFPDIFTELPKLEMIVEYKITSVDQNVVVAPTAAAFKAALLANADPENVDMFSGITFIVTTPAPTNFPTPLPTPLPPGHTHVPTMQPTAQPTEIPTTSSPTDPIPPDTYISLKGDLTDMALGDLQAGTLLHNAMFKVLTDNGQEVNYNTVAPIVEFILRTEVRFLSDVDAGYVSIDAGMYRSALARNFSVDVRNVSVTLEDATGPFQYLRTMMTTTTTTGVCMHDGKEMRDVYCSYDYYFVQTSNIEASGPLAMYQAAEGQDAVARLTTDNATEAFHARDIALDPLVFEDAIRNSYADEYVSLFGQAFDLKSFPPVLVGSTKLEVIARFTLKPGGNVSIVPPTPSEFSNAVNYWSVDTTFALESAPIATTLMPTALPVRPPTKAAVAVTAIPTRAPVVLETSAPTARPLPPTPPPTEELQWGKKEAADSAFPRGLSPVTAIIAMTLNLLLLINKLSYCN